jgi:hypothetical protein
MFLSQNDELIQKSYGSYYTSSKSIDDNYPQRDDLSSRSNAPRTPIHYEFPAVNDGQDGAQRDRRVRGRKSAGELDSEGFDDAEISIPASVSARRDLVTRYWSTRLGKAKIMTSATLIGAGLGRFLGKVCFIVGRCSMLNLSLPSFGLQ